MIFMNILMFVVILMTDQITNAASIMGSTLKNSLLPDVILIEAIPKDVSFRFKRNAYDYGNYGHGYSETKHGRYNIYGHGNNEHSISANKLGYDHNSLKHFNDHGNNYNVYNSINDGHYQPDHYGHVGHGEHYHEHCYQHDHDDHDLDHNQHHYNYKAHEEHHHDHNHHYDDSIGHAIAEVLSIIPAVATELFGGYSKSNHKLYTDGFYGGGYDKKPGGIIGGVLTSVLTGSFDA